MTAATLRARVRPGRDTPESEPSRIQASAWGAGVATELCCLAFTAPRYPSHCALRFSRLRSG
jgi:hypothetical protein